jgi:hypothetical protein
MWDKKAYDKLYYQTHRQAILDYQKQYSQTHRAKTREWKKKYAQTHAEKVKLSKNLYEQKHKSERKKYFHDYYLKHAKYYLDYCRQYQRSHPDMVKQSNRKCRQKHLTARRESDKMYYRNHPTQERDKALRQKYNSSLEEYNLLYQRQEGRCAICGGPSGPRKNFDVDHNHQTNKVRGLLCITCNLGLGAFKDRPDLLQSASKYLEAHEAVSGKDS